MKADLHVHSSASDGTVGPEQLVEMAARAGVGVLAIADHDSVAGVASALQTAEKVGVTLVPAVELSAVDGSLDLHVLGYFIDHTNADFLAELAEMRDARLARATAMVGALKAAGYDVNVDDVLRFSEGGAVGRSHIARALVDIGAVETVRRAFEDLIGHGRPFYMPKAARTPSEAIGIIHAAGGLAVIAHPGISRLPDETLVQLAALGLDGVEAYHADHSAEHRRHYARFAADHRLLATGGTDYHGPGAPNPALGDIDIPEDAVEALLARAPQR